MIEIQSKLQGDKAISAGYKLTEVGVIPEDWEVATIQDIASKITDGTHDTPKPVRDGIPFLTAIHVKAGRIDFDSCYFLPAKIHNEIYRRCNPEFGDILMVNIGSGTATTAVVNVSYEFSLKNVALIKPNNKCSGFYLNYALSFSKHKIIDTISTGGAQPFLSLSQISQLRVAKPSFKEQVAIANVISDSDDLIKSIEQLIAKKQAIKTATMQQLLSGRTRLPQFTKHPDGTLKGYKSSELGRVPEDWTVLTYGEIFDFLSTSTNARSDLSHDGEYGYIHYGDIHTKWNNKLDASVVELPKISRKLVCSSFLENGDVIMADASEDYNGIGKSIEICNIRNKKIVAGLHTYLLRDKYKQLSDGYRGYLHSNANVKKTIEQLATGMKVFGISKNNLFSVPVPVPSKQEQTAIATILSDMDAELEALEQKLAKVRDIKQGMMQQLLTGRIRLPVDHQL